MHFCSAILLPEYLMPSQVEAESPGPAAAPASIEGPALNTTSQSEANDDFQQASQASRAPSPDPDREDVRDGFQVTPALQTTQPTTDPTSTA